MDTAGETGAFENLDAPSPVDEQFLPSVIENEQRVLLPAELAEHARVEQLREDLRTLREQVAAIDRRDATQHGGLKGEIAHLVRRIARLEALPKARPTR